jgi:hypothetical protein
MKKKKKKKKKKKTTEKKNMALPLTTLPNTKDITQPIPIILMAPITPLGLKT